LGEDTDIFVGQKLPHSPSIGPDNKSSSIIRHLKKQRLFKSTLKKHDTEPDCNSKERYEYAWDSEVNSLALWPQYGVLNSIIAETSSQAKHLSVDKDCGELSIFSLCFLLLFQIFRYAYLVLTFL
jgi:hypothetical protein